MTKAIRIETHGDPDVMKWQSVEVGDPGPGEVRLRQTHAGVNFIDTYHRTGLYPPPGGLPNGLGLEGAGEVVALGPDVTDLAKGDRVCYGTGPIGSYAEERVMPADKLVKIPHAIPDRQAAGMMLRGMTVHYLIRSTFPVQSGQTVLLHAAAGGVGLIACQWLNHLGVTVIGTVGSEEKADLARRHGCHHTIVYNQEDVAERVKALTDGKGVPVVYDGVGAATFNASLDSLAPRGTLVSFGNASGPVPAFEPAILSAKGSLFITRPKLMDYTLTREELEIRARELFEVVIAKAVTIEVNQTYPLQDADEAHRDLEARETTGSVVLEI